MAHPLRQLVAMSTVGLLFVGGVAAAATGTNPLSPLLGVNEDAGPSLTTTTTTTLGTTTTTTEAPVVAAALNAEAICVDAANHGEAVSTVAKDKSTVGAEHGAAVSEMAKSDCGKVEDQDEAEPQPEPAVNPTTEQICDDAANHGEAVSTVAKDKSTVGAAHGAAVSEMAKSDCGKSDATDDNDDNDDDDHHEAPTTTRKSTNTHSRHSDDSDDDTQGS